MDAESHEKIRLVGMQQRDRPYIPARSIGSEQKRIGVSGTIASRARALCLCALVTVARDAGVCWYLTMVGASPVADRVGVSKYPRCHGDPRLLENDTRRDRSERDIRNDRWSGLEAATDRNKTKGQQP